VSHVLHTLTALIREHFPERVKINSLEMMTRLPFQQTWDTHVRFQVLMAASMMFRAVFWVILYISLMMEAVRTSETSVDNHFTRQYNPEDSCEHRGILNLDAFKGHLNHKVRRNEKGKH